MPKGGARPGAGRPKGGKDKGTIERDAALRLFRLKIARKAGELFKAQFALAMAGDNRAIESLLDRAFGKATQALEMSGPDGEPLLGQFDLTGFTTDEIQQLRSLVARASAARADRRGTSKP